MHCLWMLTGEQHGFRLRNSNLNKYLAVGTPNLPVILSVTALDLHFLSYPSKQFLA